VNNEVTSSNPAVGIVSPSPVTFDGGQFNVTTEFDPIDAGVTTLTIVTPAGFETPSATTERTATVSAPDVRLNGSPGTTFLVGNQLQRPISVSLAAAPPAPVDVTVSVGSGTIATISDNRTVNGGTTVTFPGVSGTFAGTFYLQGQSKGTTSLTASATGYDTNTSTANVTPSGFRFTGTVSDINTTSFSNNSNVPVSSVQLAEGSLTYQTIQEVRPGITINVDVTSSDPSVGVVTVSPLSFTTGSFSQTTQFDPVGPGTTLLTVLTPPGFDTPNAYTTRNANVTAPSVLMGGSTGASFTVGNDLQSSINVTLQAAPPSPVDVTVTVASGSIATIGSNDLLEGGTTVTFPGVTGTTAGTIYLQGRSVASTSMTAAATGYAPSSHTVNVVPSGFRFTGAATADFETTTFSANRTLGISSVFLNPSTLSFGGFQEIRGGFSVSVDVASATPAVGTITTSPVVFGAGDSTRNTEFDPVTAGSTLLSIATPPGFSTPNSNTQVTATVRAPDVFFPATSASVGLDLQRSISIKLEAPPPQPVDVTITSNAGSIATITQDGTVAGGTSITISGVTSTVVGTIVLQGRGLGSTTLTAQAAGYDDGSFPVTVTPAGFRYAGATNSDFTTTVGATDTALQVSSIRLNPTTLLYEEFQPVRGGITVNVDVTSSTPSVGVITSSPLVFTGGVSFQATAFDPIAVGTTDLTIEVPPGFSPSGTFRVITATVDP
jgi:hypothetical protein